MPVALQAFYFFIVCWLLAQVEIQIEGAHGWAEKLPTWRRSDSWILKLTNGKPVTGYHLYLNAFLLALVHLPVAIAGWSLALEAKVLSFFFLMTVAWDFQWFVWNPHWGIKRYFNENIWWFPKKLLGLPLEYYTGVVSSFMVILILWPQGLGEWLKLTTGIVALSAGAAILSTVISWRPLDLD